MYIGPAIIRTETRLVYPTDNFSYKGGGMSAQAMQPPLIRVRNSFREGQQGTAGWLTGFVLVPFFNFYKKNVKVVRGCNQNYDNVPRMI